MAIFYELLLDGNQIFETKVLQWRQICCAFVAGVQAGGGGGRKDKGGGKAGGTKGGRG